MIFGQLRLYAHPRVVNYALCSYFAARIVNYSWMATVRKDRSSRRAKSLVSNQLPRFFIRRAGPEARLKSTAVDYLRN